MLVLRVFTYNAKVSQSVRCQADLCVFTQRLSTWKPHQQLDSSSLDKKKKKNYTRSC